LSTAATDGGGRQAEPGESGHAGQLTCHEQYFIAFALNAFPDSRDYASIQGRVDTRGPTVPRANPISCSI